MAKLPRGQPAHVTPEVLTWARQRARLDLETVAHHLKVAPDVIRLWEIGEKKPTVPQLRAIADVYKRPIALFYLDTPPIDFSVMEEYRIHRLSNSEEASKSLSLEISAAQERRINILDVAEDLGESFGEFSLKASLDTPVADLARAVRTAMGVELLEQVEWGSTEEALKHWIRAVENLDVLVFQSSKFDLYEARGFSMFFEVLPIILLSGKDAPAGKIFTLLHELIHLILVNHNPQLIAGAQENKNKKQNDSIEKYCNDVASEVMLPQKSFMSYPGVSSITDEKLDYRILSELSKHFSVSRDMILLRIFKSSLISYERYKLYQDQIDREYKEMLQRKAEYNKNKPGGPMPHTMALRDLGTTYTRVVLEALSDSVISASTASGLLNLKVRHFDNLSIALINRLSKEAS